MSRKAVSDVSDLSEKKGRMTFPSDNRRKKKKSRVLRILFLVVAVGFCVFLGANIVSQQAQIAQLKKETSAISRKITEAEQKKDEYTELLNSDEKEYMEKVAVEKFGYAYPNERRFYVVNKDGD